ncbi:unnamed protein product [Dibothriocephalus latus]|uniref:Uncharacterized protein n=1 Tax=Dibothriocephalus latus TaxID=60516 RepID=A0A3P7QT22_DIBLA|nr:unnamed protein product [Dibothriocephalus latus]
MMQLLVYFAQLDNSTLALPPSPPQTPLMLSCPPRVPPPTGANNRPKNARNRHHQTSRRAQQNLRQKRRSNSRIWYLLESSRIERLAPRRRPR